MNIIQNLVYRLRNIVRKSNFSEQFRKLISHYMGVGCGLDILRQGACLAVSPVVVDGYAFFPRWLQGVVRVSGSVTAST